MKIIVVSALLSIAFLYGAYTEHENFQRYGNPSKYTPERSQYIRQAVSESLHETQDCLSKNSGEWCNQDLSEQQLAAFHGELYDKFNYSDKKDGPRQARNRYILFFVISFSVFLYNTMQKKLIQGKCQTSRSRTR